MVWQNSSPLWIALKNESTTIPKCEDVLLPSQIMDESHSQNNYVLNASVQKIPNTSKLIFFSFRNLLFVFIKFYFYKLNKEKNQIKLVKK